MPRFIHTSFVRCTAMLGLLLTVLIAGPASAAVSSVPVHAMAGTLEGVLNVNTATAEQWELLPGIGPATAAKIVAYRTQTPIRRLPQLMRIKGIGNKTFARIRPFLTLEGPSTLRVGPSSS